TGYARSTGPAIISTRRSVPYPISVHASGRLAHHLLLLPQLSIARSGSTVLLDRNRELDVPGGLTAVVVCPPHGDRQCVVALVAGIGLVPQCRAAFECQSPMAWRARERHGRRGAAPVHR